MLILRKGCIMLKPIRCDFLSGTLTEEVGLEALTEDLDNQRAGSHEILYYKKNAAAIWLEVVRDSIRCFNLNKNL